MTEGGYSPETIAKQETQEQQDTHAAAENESAKMSRADFLKLTGKVLAGTVLAGPMIEALAGCDLEPRRVTVEELLKNPDSFNNEDIVVEGYPVVLHKGKEMGIGYGFNPLYGKMGMKFSEDEEWSMRMYASNDIKSPYINARISDTTEGKTLPPVFPKDDLERIDEGKLKKLHTSGRWAELRYQSKGEEREYVLLSATMSPVKK